MDIDETTKALANPVRREILGWLRDPRSHFSDQDHPLEMGVCAGKIEQKAGICQSAVSAHLAVLQRVGLVSSRKVGQWVFYKRNEEAVRQYLALLMAEL